ncbi:GntR [Bartonella apihabitans]|uniref:MocR-like pyridoxine biosynthesis transcription factor PdxR n=1 Tax=Bartonella apihabitans TaxID=2750929 RepID=UPI00399825CB
MSNGLKNVKLTGTSYSPKSSRAGIGDSLYQQIINLIDSGTFQIGQRVPSIRALSRELGIGKNTVESVYSRLIGDGYLVSRGPAGTYVASHSLAPESSSKKTKTNSLKHRSIYAEGTAFKKLQIGLPSIDLFPAKYWSGLLKRKIAETHNSLFYPHSTGLKKLKESITRYVGLSRGIVCEPDQVFISSGFRGALNLLMQALGEPKDTVFLEDPCFPPTLDIVKSSGTHIVAVPVDHNGMQISDALKKHPDVKFIIVTANHQSPLGYVLGDDNRNILLDWSEKNGTFIIEDDYDSEFRYDNKPLPALASLNNHRKANMIYIGSFSKLINPDLRLGYFIVPKYMVPKITDFYQRWIDGFPILTQSVLSEFMDSGNFAKHLNKMRLNYKKRQIFLQNALNRYVSDIFHVKNFNHGLNTLLLCKNRVECNDLELMKIAQKENFGIGCISNRQIERKDLHGLILSFSNLKTQEEAYKIISDFNQVIRPYVSSK